MWLLPFAKSPSVNKGSAAAGKMIWEAEMQQKRERASRGPGCISMILVGLDSVAGAGLEPAISWRIHGTKISRSAMTPFDPSQQPAQERHNRSVADQFVLRSC